MDFVYKNATVSYDVFGEGTTLVLLHGFLEDKNMWTSIVNYFSKKYEVITVDLLGHGHSDCLGDIHTMEEQAHMIKSLLSYLQVKDCFLVGHSMGGYISLAFAKLFPESVRGITLMNSTAAADTEEKKKNRDRGIASVKKNHQLFIKTAIPMLFSQDNREKHHFDIQSVISTALQMNVQGITAVLEGMKQREDLSELYQNKQFPIQMIIGAYDPVLNAQILQQQIAGTKVKATTLSGGHMSHIESSDELIKALSTFI